MSERSDARAPLSVLVPVKNEAANLRDCLASVSFAQEIVVLIRAAQTALKRLPRQLGLGLYSLLGTENCRARRIGRWKMFSGNTNGC